MAEEISISSFEELSSLMSHLMTNYTNMALTYYTMFYDTTPTDMTIKLYDEDGNLQEYVIPNRAKDFEFCRNGEGSPEGVISAPVGTTYQDTLNGTLYLKQTGSDSDGWIKIGSDSIEKGSLNPEGSLVREKGAIYENVNTSSLYIKTTETGNTGWVLINANVDNLANRDLSNLTEEGEAKFANPSLSNLDSVGQGIIDSKENISDRVTVVNNTSTDNNYPTAKAVYTFVKDETSVLANRDLTNLTQLGEDRFLAKANVGLDNLSPAGERRISQVNPNCVIDGNLAGNYAGALDLIDAKVLQMADAYTVVQVFEYAQPGTYTFNIPAGVSTAYADIELISGGAGGTHIDHMNKFHSYYPGSTGAYFSGRISNMTVGNHSVYVGGAGGGGNGGGSGAGGWTSVDGSVQLAGGSGGANAGGGYLATMASNVAQWAYNAGRNSYQATIGKDLYYVNVQPQLAPVPGNLTGFGRGGGIWNCFDGGGAGTCGYAKVTLYMVYPEVVVQPSSETVYYKVSSNLPLTISKPNREQVVLSGVNSDYLGDKSDGFYHKYVDETGSDLITQSYTSYQEPIEPNVLYTGSVHTNGSGELRGFSSNIYITPSRFDVPTGSWVETWFCDGMNSADSWEMQFKIMAGEVASHNQFITGGDNGVYAPLIGIATNGKLFVNLSSTGNSWDIINGNQGITVLQQDEVYWIKLEFTGTKYILSLSNDGSTYRTELEVTSSAKVADVNAANRIGGAYNLDVAFTGSIFINECKLTLNNGDYWVGYRDIVDGAVWRKPGYPYGQYRWNATSQKWEEYNRVYIGALNVSGHALIGYGSASLYSNDFNVTKNRDDATWISRQTKPSGQVVASWVIGATGASYTAPCNGWFRWSFNAGGLSFYSIANVSGGVYSGQVVTAQGYRTDLLLPARGGDTLQINYQITPTDNDLYFISDEGVYRE